MCSQEGSGAEEDLELEVQGSSRGGSRLSSSIILMDPRLLKEWELFIKGALLLTSYFLILQQWDKKKKVYIYKFSFLKNLF